MLTPAEASGDRRRPPMVFTPEQERYYRYEQEFDAQAAEVREGFEAALEAAALPSEVGMAHRQRLNAVALDFIRGRATDFVNMLEPDIQETQQIFFDKFIPVNRQMYYDRIATNPVLEGTLARHALLLAAQAQKHFPEIRFARRLFEQLYEPSDLPFIERQARIKAVQDCMIIYGLTLDSARPRSGSGRIRIASPPHILRGAPDEESPDDT